MSDQSQHDRALLEAIHDHVVNASISTYDVTKAHVAADMEKMRAEMRADLERATGGRFAEVRDNILVWLNRITVPDVTVPTTSLVPAPPASAPPHHPEHRP
jgi:hypothetical protein